MKIRSLWGLLLFVAFCATGVNAQSRYIVRVSGGLPLIQGLCGSLLCNVVGGLDSGFGQVYLLTTNSGVDPNAFLASLTARPGVVDAEMDQVATTTGNKHSIPAALTDVTPILYYGTTVIDGYVHQPATTLIQMEKAQSQFNAAGAGIAAVIDTGVDPSHPVLAKVLLPGYDATTDMPGADETLEVLLPSTPVTSGTQPNWTNDNSAALVDQSTAAVIDGNPKYSAFGHGTMVAGIVHLTAPHTQILPIKAFQANGTGYNSDIIRGFYYAVQHGASVINMSFNLAGYSQELKNATDFAAARGIVSVASSGNGGNILPLYPASYPNVVSVASTTNTDQLSTFSSYGSTVWLGAPGEGVVTTYPYGTYAAVWGTSFSAPFVSGTVALMRGMQLFCNQSQGSQALAHADQVPAPVGNGRLDIVSALQAWSQTMAMP